MIITFYSYKGGVGRTSLAANLAACLCYRFGKKVLLIDWDLEAPGMNFYFNKGYADIQKEGLIDVLKKYVQLVRQNKNLSEEELPRITQDNIVPLKDFKKEGGRIDLLPAGNYHDFKSYLNTIFDFNWYEFYDLLDGKKYIEFLKKELKKLDYDYIFIDSRTGLADYADICNIQMPDMNIVVCAPNRQNIDGSYEVVNRIVTSPYVQSGKFRKPIVLPILSRVEQESPEFSKYFDTFRDNFSFLLENFKEFNEDYFSSNSFFRETMIGYNRFIAVGENVLFSEDNSDTKDIYGTSQVFLYISSIIQSLRNALFPKETNGQDYPKLIKEHNLRPQMINLIVRGKLNAAISLLMENQILISNEDVYAQLILISSRLNYIQNKELTGVIGSDEVKREINRITVSLIDVLNSLNETLITSPTDVKVVEA